MAAKFPAYQSILPTTPPTECSAFKADTLASLERIVAMSNRTSSSATLSLYPQQDEMRLSTKTDKGDVEDIIEMEYEGPEVVFNMNPKFLVDVIKRLHGDNVVYNFRFKGKKIDGIVEISEGPYRNFISPLRDC